MGMERERGDRSQPKVTSPLQLFVTRQLSRNLDTFHEALVLHILRSEHEGGGEGHCRKDKSDLSSHYTNGRGALQIDSVQIAPPCGTTLKLDNNCRLGLHAPGNLEWTYVLGHQ
jgi:hypothetical protein